MKVLMLQDMSGSHDGKPYLSRGEVDDLDDAHGQALIDSGAAVLSDGKDNKALVDALAYAKKTREDADALAKEAADAQALADAKAHDAAVAGTKANTAESNALSVRRGTADLSIGAQADAEVASETAPADAAK